MTARVSLYLGRESIIHRLHPTTKLALAGLLLVGCLVLPAGWLSYALLVIVLASLAAWRISLPFAISVFFSSRAFCGGQVEPPQLICLAQALQLDFSPLTVQEFLDSLGK